MRISTLFIVLCLAILGMSSARAEYPQYFDEFTAKYPSVSDEELKVLYDVHTKETSVANRVKRSYENCLESDSNTLACAAKLVKDYTFAVRPIDGYKGLSSLDRRSVGDFINAIGNSVKNNMQLLAYHASRFMRLVFCFTRNMLGTGFQMGGDALACAVHDLVHNMFVDLFVLAKTVDDPSVAGSTQKDPYLVPSSFN